MSDHQGHIYEVLNQALKGILAGLGSGSGPTRSGHLITLREPIAVGEPLWRPELQRVKDLGDGCYLIVASKVVAISEGRILTVARDPLPPRRSPRKLLEVLQAGTEGLNVPLTDRDAYGADLLVDNGATLTFSLLPIDPNRSAATLASEIETKTGTKCDVVITDTSAGWQKGLRLIGTPTFVATPIGATAGCDLYYAQRLAALAEVMRNENGLSPYVIVQPPTARSRIRHGCGEFRYPGFLNAAREDPYLEGWE